MDGRFGWRCCYWTLVVLCYCCCFPFLCFFLNSFRTDSIHAAQANLKHFSLLALAGTTGLHYHTCLKDKLGKDQVSNQRLVLHIIYTLG